jgi:DMSO/TMAO reductase YedYZ molybdopterin-dependent catalytic subunit
MIKSEMSRRALLKASGITLAGLALVNSPRFAQAAPLRQGDTVVPWLDQPPENPIPQVLANQLEWEDLDSWITPNEEFFSVAHYSQPEVDVEEWQLEIAGLVQHPMTFTLDELKTWPRQEVTYTLECAGNHGFDWFTGGIGNAQWAGIALGPLLEEAGILPEGREVVFYGADTGIETIREQEITQNFARSMSLEDAMSPNNLLCYEMNGEPLPQANGFPLRLIAPGWYGIANVKWLQRIEVRSSRLMNRFMARDYVTLREEEQDGESVWVESSVGRSLLKSAPARVVQSGDQYRIDGAAWGSPIRRVEVQIDDGPWQQAQLDRQQSGRFAWKFWSLEWEDATPGEHTITTRATDTRGNVQPAQDDPLIANKVTYWESNGQITRQVELPA